MAKEQKQLLYMRCSEEDWETVRQIIQSPGTFDLNNLNEHSSNDGTTLLHRACLDGNLALVQLLLHQGADIGVRDREANTSLHKASSNGFLSIVQLLLKAVTNEVTCETVENKTTVSAYYTGATAAESYVSGFSNGNFINMANYRFQTALDLARESQHVDVAQFLIESGAGSGDLLSACHCLKFKETQTIIENSATPHADVKITSVYGLNSLHYSICSIKTVQLLCSNGADPKITDGDGNTPLHFLVEGEDSKDVIKTLVNQRANINTRNHQGKTPLHHACIRLQTRVVECLLHVGADSSVQDNSGATPLHYLALYHKLDVSDHVVGLLQRVMRNRIGLLAKPINELRFSVAKTLSPFNQNVLHDVHVKGYSKYVTNKQDEWHYLVCRTMAFDWNVIPNDAVNPYPVGGKEHLDIIDLIFLCSRHENVVNCKENNGRTPLHISAGNGSIEVAKHLIEHHKADLCVVDIFGTTALHEAVINGSLPVVRLVLRESEKSGCKDKLLSCRDSCRKHTALHKAIEGVNADILDELLRHKPDVNVVDFGGNTPLHLAVSERRLFMQLISADARTGVKNDVGNTQLHSAAALPVSDCQLKIVKCLLTADGVAVNEKNVAGRTPLHFATWNGSNRLIRLLCVSDASVDIADDDGNTPLHFTNYISDEAIDLLIDHASDINVLNNQKMTPLHMACMTRSLQYVSKLLRHGAVCNAVDAFGATPLHYACCRHLRQDNASSYDPVIRTLLQHGADCNIQMKVTGKTPLHLACQSDEVEQARELMEHGNSNIDIGVRDVLGNSVSQCLSSSTCLHTQLIPLQFVPSSAIKHSDLPKNHCGLTWLHAYSKAGHFAWIPDDYLPSAAVQDNLGRSCIHIALTCSYHLADSFRDDYGLCTITDFLGRNCFHHLCISQDYYHECSDSFLQLVCSHQELVNARDAHGRTPLFYAVIYQSSTFVDQLLSAGADPEMIADYVTITGDSIKSISIKSNVVVKGSETNQRQSGEKSRERCQSKMYEVWENIQPPTASNSYTRVLREQTTEFVSKIMNKVAELDPLFTSTQVLVGSSLEGTRADRTYDEFDFMIILDNFESLLDYSSHHERFPTYIRLRDNDNTNKTRYQQYTNGESVVQPIFVKERLYSLLIRACYSPDLWRNSPFECLRTRLKNDRYSPAVAIKMSLNNLIDDEQRLHFYRFNQISVDFVPAVPTNWKLLNDSKFARYVDLHVPETVDRRGFAVLKPHKYSVGNDTNGYCPVTFILLESEVIRQLPTVRAAYTMVKWLLFCRDVVGLRNPDYEVEINKYALKTCVIQCVIENRFRRETLHEVTQENLMHCAQIIFQLLWRCVQEDRIQNMPMPHFYQPIWKFEPFSGFMKAYLSLYGLLYTSDLYDPDMRVEEFFGFNETPSDMSPLSIGLQKKTKDVIGKFRHSYASLRKLCEMLSVRTVSNNSEDTEQCSSGYLEQTRQDLISYAIKYNAFGNEFDVHENTRSLQVESPHCITTNWTD